MEYAPGEYAVNHSSAVILLDPKARYVARFPAPHYAADLTELFLKIEKIQHILLSKGILSPSMMAPGLFILLRDMVLMII